MTPEYDRPREGTHPFEWNPAADPARRAHGARLAAKALYRQAQKAERDAASAVEAADRFQASDPDRAAALRADAASLLGCVPGLREEAREATARARRYQEV